MPVRMEMVVVLPAPLCPSNAVICPRRAANCKPSTAVLPPNLFTSPLTRIAASSGDCRDCDGVDEDEDKDEDDGAAA